VAGFGPVESRRGIPEAVPAIKHPIKYIPKGETI
jgi:hypothetical protein